MADYQLSATNDTYNYTIAINGGKLYKNNTTEEITDTAITDHLYFDISSGTWTMSGLSFETHAAVALGSNQNDDVIITVMGDNTLISGETAEAFGVTFKSSLTLQGDGALTVATRDTVSQQNVAIFSHDGNVTIDGIVLDASAGVATDMSAAFFTNQGVFVKSGTVTAHGGAANTSVALFAGTAQVGADAVLVAEGLAAGAFFEEGAITVFGGTTPVAMYDASGNELVYVSSGEMKGIYTDQDGNIATYITNVGGASYDYYITINGGKLYKNDTTEEITDTAITSHLTFNGGTWTMSGLNFTTTAGCGIWVADGTVITVEGNNSVSVSHEIENLYAISGGSVTLQGTGSLDVISDSQTNTQSNAIDVSSLTVDGVSLNVSAGSSVFASTGIAARLTVLSGNVHVVVNSSSGQSKGIVAVGILQILGGTVTTVVAEANNQSIGVEAGEAVVAEEATFVVHGEGQGFYGVAPITVDGTAQALMYDANGDALTWDGDRKTYLSPDGTVSKTVTNDSGASYDYYITIGNDGKLYKNDTTEDITALFSDTLYYNGGTWTMTGLSFNTTAGYGILVATDTVITVSDSNRIIAGNGSNESFGVFSEGQMLTLQGNGLLNVSARNTTNGVAIGLAGGELAIDGITLNVFGGNAGSYSMGISASSLTVSNAIVKTGSGSASEIVAGIITSDMLQIQGGTVIASADSGSGVGIEASGGAVIATNAILIAKGADSGFSGPAITTDGETAAKIYDADGNLLTWNEDLYTYVDASGNAAKYVTNQRGFLIDYYIRIENNTLYKNDTGEEITDAEITDHLYYDYDNDTWYMSGLTLDVMNGRGIVLVDEAVITVNGSNRIFVGNGTDDSCGFAFDGGSLSLKGNGSLSVTAYDTTGSASYAMKGESLSVNGVTLNTASGNAATDAIAICVGDIQIGSGTVHAIGGTASTRSGGVFSEGAATVSRSAVFVSEGIVGFHGANAITVDGVESAAIFDAAGNSLTWDGEAGTYVDADGNVAQYVVNTKTFDYIIRIDNSKLYNETTGEEITDAEITDHLFCTGGTNWIMSDFFFNTSADGGIIIATDAVITVVGDNSITVGDGTNSARGIDSQGYYGPGVSFSLQGSGSLSVTLRDAPDGEYSNVLAGGTIVVDGISLNIVAGGKATVGSYGVSCSTLTIQNANVYVAGGNDALYSIGLAGEITIVNSNVTAVGGTARGASIGINGIVSIDDQSTLVAKGENFGVNGAAITTGGTQTAVYDADGNELTWDNTQYTYVSGGTVAKYVTNVKNYNYYITINGGKLYKNDTTEEITDSAITSHLFFNGGTWTMSDFSFSTTARYGIVLETDAVITVVGSNTLIGGNDGSGNTGITFDDCNLLLQGTGSLSVTARETSGQHSYAMSNDGDGSLTINGVTLNAIAGNATRYSEGIEICGGNLVIQSGTVHTVGGSASDDAYGAIVVGRMTVATDATFVGEGVGTGYIGLYEISSGVSAKAVYDADGNILTWSAENNVYLDQDGNAATYVSTVGTSYDYYIRIEGGKLYKNDTTEEITDTAITSHLTFDGGTWTMSGLAFNTSRYKGILCEDSTTITVNGANFITAGDAETAHAFESTAASVTLQGTGSLNLTAKASVDSSALFLEKKSYYLTVDGITLNCVAGNGTDSSVGLNAGGGMTVKSGTVTAVGGTAGEGCAGIFARSMQVSDEAVIIAWSEGYGYYGNNAITVLGGTTAETIYDDAGNALTWDGTQSTYVSGGTIAKYVTNSRSRDYYITIGDNGKLYKNDTEEVITESAITDHLSYNGGTWTMSDFFFETTARYGIVLETDAVITVVGSNTLIGGNNIKSSYVVSMDYYNLVLQGSGSLSVTVRDTTRSYAEAFDSANGTLTINGITLHAVTGTAESCSDAICMTNGNLVIQSGTVHAVAGTASDEALGIFVGGTTTIAAEAVVVSEGNPAGVYARSEITIDGVNPATMYDADGNTLTWDSDQKIYVSGGTAAKYVTNQKKAGYERFVATSDNPVTLEAGKTYTNPEYYNGNGAAGEVQTNGVLTAVGTAENKIVFSGNTASEKGGAVFIDGGTAMFSQVTFSGNLALSTFLSYREGGAIYMNGGTATFADVTFSGNQGDAGGAVKIDDGKSTFANVTFTNNVSDEGGGAIYIAGGTSTFANVTFSGNTADGAGAIANDGGTITLAGTVTLATASDTFLNIGSVIWDLSQSNVMINGYQYFSNYGGAGTSYLKVDNTVESGASFTIATGVGSSLTDKDTFKLTGLAGDDVAITVGGGAVSYNGLDYTLAQSGDALVLSAAGGTYDYYIRIEGGKLYKNDTTEEITDTAITSHLTFDGSTWTMSNFSFDTTAGRGIRINADTIITVAGTNHIIAGNASGENSAIDFEDYNFTLNGTGTLSAVSRDTTDTVSVAICSDSLIGSLTVDGVTLLVTAGNSADLSEGIVSRGGMTIQSGTVYAHGGTASSQSFGVAAGGTVTVAADAVLVGEGNIGGYYGTNAITVDGTNPAVIYDADGNELTWDSTQSTYVSGATIAKYITNVGGASYDYYITINGSKLYKNDTTEEITDTAITSHLSFNGGTWTMSNFSFNTTAHFGIRVITDTVITVSGVNSLVSGNDLASGCVIDHDNADLVLQGTGSLSVKQRDSSETFVAGIGATEESRNLTIDGITLDVISGNSSKISVAITTSGDLIIKSGTVRTLAGSGKASGGCFVTGTAQVMDGATFVAQGEGYGYCGTNAITVDGTNPAVIYNANGNELTWDGTQQTYVSSGTIAKYVTNVGYGYYITINGDKLYKNDTTEEITDTAITDHLFFNGGTWTMSNFSFDTTNGWGIAVASDAVITVSGNNSLRAGNDVQDADVFLVDGDIAVTLQGTGTLTLTANASSGNNACVRAFSIISGSSVTIDGITLHASCGAAENQSIGIYSMGDLLQIKSGTVTATGGSAAYGAGIAPKSMQISDAAVVVAQGEVFGYYGMGAITVLGGTTPAVIYDASGNELTWDQYTYVSGGTAAKFITNQGKAGYERFVATSTNPVTLVAGKTYTNPEFYNGNGAAGEVQTNGVLTAVGTAENKIVFSGNTAYDDGGAVCVDGGTAIFSQVIFSGNTSVEGTGGAMILTDATSTFAHVSFINNFASEAAGAVYIADGTATFADVTFSGNTTKNDNGAVICSGGTIILAGTVTLSTASDAFFNAGSVVWDLSQANVMINGYEYFTNISEYGGTCYLKVNNTVESGASFTIATGVGSSLTDKDTFKITGLAGDDVTITAGGGAVSYNGMDYTLTQTNGNLVLSAERGTYDYYIRIEGGKLYKNNTAEEITDTAITSHLSFNGGTWTMSGLNFKSNQVCAIRVVDAAVITVSGVNALSATNAASSITVSATTADLTLQGSGSLSLTAGDTVGTLGYGLAAKNLVLDGITLDVTSGNAATNSYGIAVSGALQVKGGTVTATGGTASSSVGVSAASAQISETAEFTATGAEYGFYGNSAITADGTNPAAIYDASDNELKWNNLHFYVDDNNVPAKTVTNVGTERILTLTLTPVAVNLVVGGEGVVTVAVSDQFDKTYTVTGLDFSQSSCASFTPALGYGSFTVAATHAGKESITVTATLENGKQVSANLALNVAANPGAFYCSTWANNQVVYVTWHGKEFYGTVGDGTFFNDYSGAKTKVASNNDFIVVMESSTIGSPVSYDAQNVYLSCDNAVYTRMILGGELINGSHEYTGDYTVNIEGGTYMREVAGGDASNKYVDRTGNITLNISGGIFVGHVLGGSYYSAKNAMGSAGVLGDINFTISGGVFEQRVYGGCGSMTEETSSRAAMDGNVYLTIDASTNAIDFQECVAAGNRGYGLLLGSTNVTVTGFGENLTFADSSVLFGGCGGDYYNVDGGARTAVTSVVDPVTWKASGVRALTFSNFTGDFGAEIRMFSDITFGDNTLMNFADANLDLKEIEKWNFDCTSFASNLTKNQFTGDTINVDTLALTEGNWTLLAGSEAAFADLGLAASVTLGGATATYNGTAWTTDNFSLTVEDQTKLVISKIA